MAYRLTQQGDNQEFSILRNRIDALEFKFHDCETFARQSNSRYGKNVWQCLDSVVISRQYANNKLVEANKNLVAYDDGYELDDEIKDMISQ